MPTVATAQLEIVCRFQARAIVPVRIREPVIQVQVERTIVAPVVQVATTNDDIRWAPTANGRMLVGTTPHSDATAHTKYALLIYHNERTASLQCI